MKSYKITIIVQHGIRWVLNNRTGDYYAAGIEGSKHIMDFFGDSIISCINRTSDNQDISIGNTFQQGDVIGIHFEKGKPKIEFGSRTGHVSVNLDQVSIIPVARPATRSAVAVASENKSSITRETIVEKIKSSLVGAREIRLEKTKKERKENAKDFLIKFFKENNVEKNTIYVDTKEVQTIPNKRRSFGDIYQIMNYYYPDFTIENLIDLLYKDLPKNLNNFRSSYCNQIKKRTFYYDSREGSGIYNQNIGDEYGFRYNDYLK